MASIFKVPKKGDTRLHSYSELGAEILNKNRALEELNRHSALVEKLYPEKEQEVHKKERVLADKAELLDRLEKDIYSHEVELTRRLSELRENHTTENLKLEEIESQKNEIEKNDQELQRAKAESEKMEGSIAERRRFLIGEQAKYDSLIKEVENKKKRVDHEIMLKNNEVKELKDTEESYKREVKSYTDSLSKLKEGVSHEQEKYSKLSSNFRKTTIELKEKLKSIGKMDKKINYLTGDLASLEKKDQRKRAEYAEIKLLVDQAIKRYKQIMKVLKSKKSEIDRHSTHLTKKERYMAQHMERMSIRSLSVKDKEFDVRKRESNLLKLIKSNEKLLDSIEVSKRDQQSILEKMGTEIKEKDELLKKKEMQYGSKIGEFELKMQELKEKKKEMEGEVAEKEVSLNKLQKDIEASQKELEKQAAEKRAELNKLKFQEKSAAHKRPISHKKAKHANKSKQKSHKKVKKSRNIVEEINNDEELQEEVDKVKEQEQTFKNLYGEMKQDKEALGTAISEEPQPSQEPGPAVDKDEGQGVSQVTAKDTDSRTEVADMESKIRQKDELLTAKDYQLRALNDQINEIKQQMSLTSTTLRNKMHNELKAVLAIVRSQMDNDDISEVRTAYDNLRQIYSRLSPEGKKMIHGDILRLREEIVNRFYTIRNI